MNKVATFLMFEGSAEEAMNLYASVFTGFVVGEIARWEDGKILRADAVLRDHPLKFFDSNIKHEFTFTPSISLWVECQDLSELERCFAALSEGGKILMPLDDYGFSQRYGWLSDRFGVSWQLNLA